MSVLLTVSISIAALLVGCLIGYCVKQKKTVKDVKQPVLLSRVMLPKRISAREYNKRVNAALKEVVNKTVDVWIMDSKEYKHSLANELYREWHSKLDNISYSKYDPKFQCLAIIGRSVTHGFRFDAFWIEKKP